jgi:hypothetical protein
MYASGAEEQSLDVVSIGELVAEERLETPAERQA